MPEPLTTLPTALLGNIPKLLLRASPIVYVGPDRHRFGWIGLIEQVHYDGRVRIAWNAGVHGVEKLEHVALDLTDATGRAQAAAWADKATTYNTIEFMQQLDAGTLPSLDERRAMDVAMRFADMTPAQIDALCRLCLRLAGRAS